MKCFNDFLNTPIGQSCPELVGMRPNAVIYPRTGVASWNINTDNTIVTITFKEGVEPIGVFMPEQLPYKPTVEGTKNDFGLTKFTKKVTFFFVENTHLSHEQIISLQNDGYVLVAVDNVGRSLVFGLEAGLRFLTSSQDFNSTDTHGGIVVEMQEANCNYSMLFTTANAIVPLVGLSNVETIFTGVKDDTLDWGSTMVFDPTNATIKDLIYHSEDPTNVTVDDDGLITIVSENAFATKVTAKSVYAGFTLTINVDQT